MVGRYTICLNYGRAGCGQRHYGFISPGAYAQYNVYSFKSIKKLPDTVSFREGALVDTAGVTLHGMELSGVTAGGTVALLGVPSDAVQEKLPYKYIVHNEIAIFGSRANPNVSWKIIEAIASGRLVVRDLITHVFPLEDFKQALETFVVRKEGAVKVVIEPNGSEKTGLV